MKRESKLAENNSKKVKMAAILLFLCAIVWVRSPVAGAAESHAAAAPKTVAALIGNLLHAIQANDYQRFVADGTAKFKEGLTKEVFESVSTQLASRMKKGYAQVYLGRLHQHGYELYLWKLTFIDGGDDILAKMVVKDGRIAGFWLY